MISLSSVTINDIYPYHKEEEIHATTVSYDTRILVTISLFRRVGDDYPLELYISSAVDKSRKEVEQYD